jgi:predicted metal-binding protein
MTTWITICDTCKRDGWEDSQMDLTDGEVLAALIEERAKGTVVKTRRVSCLMGCTRSCNIAIQAPGKLAYTLGEFAPDAEAATAIIDYANLHAASDTGQVPYRTWPQPIKGHFVTRHPPLPASE